MTISDIRFIKLTTWQWLNPFYRPLCPKCRVRMKNKILKVSYRCKSCECIVLVKED